ncbi:MAG: hypothetical protein WKF76_05020 [Nocardioidaceae bacterium]
MLVTGLLLAPRMSVKTVTLIQLGVVGVGLGLASAVGSLLRRLRLAEEAASGDVCRFRRRAACPTAPGHRATLSRV